MAWTLSTSGGAVAKAGANVNSTIAVSGLALERWSDEAEATVSMEARKDLVAAGLTIVGAKILATTCSALIAQEMIIYDPSGFGSMREAETKLDVLENEIRRNLKKLGDSKYKEYLGIS